MRLGFCESGIIPGVSNACTYGRSADRALLFWRYKRAAWIGLASRRFPGGPFLRRRSRVRQQLWSFAVRFCGLGFLACVLTLLGLEAGIVVPACHRF